MLHKNKAVGKALNVPKNVFTIGGVCTAFWPNRELMLTGNGFTPLDGANPVPGSCSIAMASANTEAAWTSPQESISSRIPGGRVDIGAVFRCVPVAASPSNVLASCNGHAERSNGVGVGLSTIETPR